VPKRFSLHPDVFPIGGMPPIVRWLTQLAPANRRDQILRGIVLRGATTRATSPRQSPG
jgi:hypothetical protein